MKIEKRSAYNEKLIISRLKIQGKHEYNKYLWSLTPSTGEENTDLDLLEDILTSVEVGELETEQLYMLIRTYFWKRKIDEALDLISELLSRKNHTDSQVINACLQASYNCPENTLERFIWIDKSLKKMHYANYGRFKNIYKKTSKRLLNELMVEDFIDDEFIEYPDLLSCLEKIVSGNNFLVSFVYYAIKENKLITADRIIDVKGARELSEFINIKGDVRIFSEINKAIKGLEKHDENLIKNLIKNCFKAFFDSTNENKSTLVEIAVMTNSLLQFDVFSRESNYNLIITLIDSQPSPNCRMYYSLGLAYYALGQYANAENSFRKFSLQPVEKVLFHQTSASAFKEGLSQNELNVVSESSLGDVNWLFKTTNEGDLTILVSCDPGYFAVYSKSFIERLSFLNGSVNIHFHVVYPAGFNILESIASDIEFAREASCGMTLEEIGFGDVKTYSSVARYLIALEIINEYRKPLFISDIDLVIEQDPRFLIEIDSDKVGLFIGSDVHTFFPWQYVKAGAGFYPMSSKSFEFIQHITNFVKYSYLKNLDGWMLDQMATEYAFRKSTGDDFFYDIRKAGFHISQVKERAENRLKAQSVIDLQSNRNKLLHYECNRQNILDRLRLQLFSTFKVGLKTKDEPELLEKWINHYGDIFGYENIIIFDNGSSNTEVFAIYDRYRSLLGAIFQFGNNSLSHNSIHYPSSYTDIYKCLKTSCDYFAIFDTDEFLYYVDGSKCVKGSLVLEKLIDQSKKYTDQKNGKALFTFWLNEMPENYSYFKLGRDNIHLYKGIRDGKHFLPSSVIDRLQSGHNSCAPASVVPDEIDLNFFLFHHRTVTPERRIRVNYNKLYSRGVLENGVSVADIVSRPSREVVKKGRLSPTIQGYLNEISRLCQITDTDRYSKVESTPCVSGAMHVADNGEINYTDEKAKDVLTSFLKDSNMKNQVSLYLKSEFSCLFNQVPMIELGVYGEFGLDEYNRFSGWCLDSICYPENEVQVKVGNQLIDKFQPSNPKVFKNIREPLSVAFNYVLKKDVFEEIQSRYIDTDPVIRFVSRRTGKALKSKNVVRLSDLKNL